MSDAMLQSYWNLEAKEDEFETRLRYIVQFIGQRGREGEVGGGRVHEKEEVGGERRRKRGKSKLMEY